MVILEASKEKSVPLKSRPEDTQEVLNYVKAMEYGLKRLGDLPVCLRLIKELHDRLLRSVRGSEERPGEFRSHQNFIGKRDDGISLARFVPPPVQEMQLCLDDLERYLNEPNIDVPLLVQLALTHYQFEAIHPFRDGNGRVGRLLLPLLLINRGRLPEPVLYLSSYFERNNEEYASLLLRVSQRGDYEAWIRFFLQGVVECSQEAVEQVQAIRKLHESYLERFRTARSTALLQKLIDELFRDPSTTIAKTAKLLGITQAAASTNIRKLQKAGILAEVTGNKRNQFFLANAILDFADSPRKPKPNS